MDSANHFSVSIAYGHPRKLTLINILVEENTIVREAIEKSGILNLFPEINLECAEIGVFGKIIELSTPLHHLDRIEIYCPLMIDPRQARRDRASKS
ncbi:RnfH family protein [Candidatus Nitrosacidococcus tergens]|nr:RnfH family protein [Candidatus Nitrosacidococcus tergens]